VTRGVFVQNSFANDGSGEKMHEKEERHTSTTCIMGDEMHSFIHFSAVLIPILVPLKRD
jgi:hypothetical protein